MHSNRPIEDPVSAPFSKDCRNILSLFNIVREGNLTFPILAVIAPTTKTTERR
jgi:hypothetical protein